MINWADYSIIIVWRVAQAFAAKYHASCVPAMFGSQIFDAMLDKEIPKLYPIPDIKDAVDTFREAFNEATDLIGQKVRHLYAAVCAMLVVWVKYIDLVSLELGLRHASIFGVCFHIYLL